MISIYVHVPFCTSKCYYCGFYSTVYYDAVADNYLDALEREIVEKSGLLANRNAVTIYIGGGTPSVLSHGRLTRLLNILGKVISFATLKEISCEINPHSGSQDVLDCLARSGVTRVSIGVQSFSNEVLRTLMRPHGSDQAVRTVIEAQRSGFRSVGLDLMYGVPDQTMKDWSATVEEACRLRPGHLSLYALSLDHGSRLSDDVRSGTRTLPEDELAASMYELGCERLQQAGYHQYEISNFSLPGHECLHNRHYWERGEYIGLGPSATSFVGNRRSTNISDVREYVDRIRTRRSIMSFEETLSDRQAATEILMLGLRKTSGVDLRRFAAMFGAELRDAVLGRAREMNTREMLEIDDRTLRLTSRGMLLSNDVIARLVP
jgi:oxygen-independent coproporphyrinogen-3 oxidase